MILWSKKTTGYHSFSLEILEISDSLTYLLLETRHPVRSPLQPRTPALGVVVPHAVVDLLRGGSAADILVRQPLDLEHLRSAEERLEPLGLHVNLPAVDIADQTLHVHVGGVPQDHHGMAAGIILK